MKYLAKIEKALLAITIIMHSRGQRRYKTTEVTRKFSYKSKEERLRRLMGVESIYLVRKFQWDEPALWSLTNFQIGQQICKYLLACTDISSQSVITDAFASVGGNVIPFAKNFAKVHAIELDGRRKKMLDANLHLFALKNVETYSDYFQNVLDALQHDVVYFDPPWGLDYRKYAVNSMRITVTGPSCDDSLEDIIITSQKTAYCVVKLPFNYDLCYFRDKIVSVGDIIHIQQYARPNTMILVVIRYF